MKKGDYLVQATAERDQPDFRIISIVNEVIIVEAIYDNLPKKVAWPLMCYKLDIIESLVKDGELIVKTPNEYHQATS